MADRLITDLARRLGEELRARGWTVAAAESCTGGEVCAAITDVPGSSGYFVGGIVAYDNAVKVRELFVPEDVIVFRGAVSEEVAAAMADGVRRRFGSDVGIGTTGVAGPSGGTPEKPVGTVCVGISAGDVRLSHRIRLSGDREAVRLGTVAFALETLLGLLRERKGEVP